MTNLFDDMENQMKEQEGEKECSQEEDNFFLSPTDTLSEEEIEEGDIEEEVFTDLFGNAIEDAASKKAKAKKEQEEKAKQAQMKLEQSKAERAKKAEEQWTKVIPLGTTVAYAGYYQVLTEDTTQENIRLMILKAGYPEMGAKSDVHFKYHEDLNLLNATIGGGKAGGGDDIPPQHIFKNLMDWNKSLRPLDKLEGMKHPNVTTPVRYVYGIDGLYAVQKNKMGIFTSFVRPYSECSDTNLEGKVTEAFQLTLPKIPISIMKPIQGLFHYYADRGVEVTALLWWNIEKAQYEVTVPLQSVTPVSSDWEHDDEWYDKHILVMDLHSHHNLPSGAYFSSIDNCKDMQTKFYGVMGHVSSPFPQLLVSYVCAGKRVIIPTSLYGKLFNLDEENLSIPEEWATQVVMMEGSESHAFL